jgi:hypothetical protein
MLIRPGFWSSSKGMVLVPNIVGLSTTAANAAISAASLANSGNTTTNTSDSGLNGKIASQDPVSGTKVQYETNVSYVSYNYIAAPPPPPPIIIINEPPPIIIINEPPPPQPRLCTQAQIEFGFTCPSPCYVGGWGALC